MDAIWQEIGISLQHVSETSVPDRYQVICDKQWLQLLERKHKIGQFKVHKYLDRRAHPSDPLEHPWTRIMVQTYRKYPQKQVFPLPRQATNIAIDTCELGGSVIGAETLPLTYSQAVSNVAKVNFRLLWEAAYKKYSAAHVKFSKETPSLAPIKCNLVPPIYGLLSYDNVMKDLIGKIFKCPLINSKLDRLKSDSSDIARIDHECHPNILPAIAAIETSTHISVLFYPPAIFTNLSDCITYSPAILSNSYNKPLFLIYQLLQLSKALQTMGLLLGDIRLRDILMHDNLWLHVVPSLEANMLQFKVDDDDEGDKVADAEKIGDKADALDYDDAHEYCTNTKFDLKFAYDLNHFSLREYCEMWCNGQLSNYDYLTILNNAAGRTMGNPSYHHIMPWVTDFTARNGQNWRDLTKSKYRLNKGDIHLDLMFSQTINAIGQDVPHHVSDFLSEITYFVYMSRRTAQHVLCEHVRPIWVPAEYPVSIQRLQEWTPDECIPEFYSDPMVFKSIHEDLPDLELPAWATCPEDFVCKHREALESQHVSERLQHWIDLNFGYKLSGKAAVKAKNVCLSLVDQHSNLCQRGIVQLFALPHPPKRFPSPGFERTPPRLQHLYRISSMKSRKWKHNYEKRLAKSTENLHVSSAESLDEKAQGRPPRGVSPRTSLRCHAMHNENSLSCSNFYQSTNFIELPKDYQPSALLHGLETMQTFFAHTFPRQNATKSTEEKVARSDLLFDENIEEHSFTNHLFTDNNSMANRKAKTSFLLPGSNLLRKQSLKQLLKERRQRELQVMGCLIVELFSLQSLRPMIINSFRTTFEDRLQACRTAFRTSAQDIPSCLRSTVKMLLQLETEETVTDKGLPPISAAQILEPIFANALIPFPSTYYPTYALIRSLQSFDFDRALLELHTHFNCDGTECSKYSDMDRKRVLFERKIAECKVMSCCAHIEQLLEPLAYEQFTPIELLLPHIISLLTTEQTAILAAWNLFDPIAQALGIANTQKYLLAPIMKLYDIESFERCGTSSTRSHSNLPATENQLRFSTSSSFKSRKSVKLYHHSFLLRLIVRFGLRCFLNNFIAPLIEAVGGYKEPDEGTGLHYHNSSSSESTRRTSKSLHFAQVSRENGLTLISNDIINHDLDDNAISTQMPVIVRQEMEDVFTFDEDAGSDRISNSGTSENKSVDSFELRPTAAEEAKEDEGGGGALDTTPEIVAISEIIYGQKISNASFEDADRISLKSQNAAEVHCNHLGAQSPTIAIPSSSLRHSYQLNTIDCDVGSKRSVDSFDIISEVVEEEEQKRENRQYEDSIDSTDERHAESPEVKSSLQDSVISKMTKARLLQNNRISEMSADSLIWLSHRLGPALTSRFITRNLLKILSLCYVGQESLLPHTYENVEAGNLNYFSVADAKVIGDRNASRVLDCLVSIAALFGEEVILLQYLPHISELIGTCQKRITASLEGAIISSLQLLKYIVPCLVDATIMEHLKDVILDAIILPIISLLGSTKILMPNGYLGRSVLARKLLDAIYVLCVRIGPDMSKELICGPALSPFFLIFDKAYGISNNVPCLLESDRSSAKESSPLTMPENAREREELRDVFGPALAHTAYLSFLHFLGEAIMQRSLLNLNFILTLCHEFEQPNYRSDYSADKRGNDTVDTSATDLNNAANEPMAANSFGINVIGNRIEVVDDSSSKQPKEEVGPMEVLDMVAYKFDHVPNTRHLKGNWLAYWRHEISRPEKDFSLNLKQIRLQLFAGHTNSVRAIVALDNENSFISASKDKTVKLWSLRSEGHGKKVSSCQFTYTAHKKSIHSLAFLEAMRLVVSCDSGLHLWDPFIGRPLAVLDSPKHNPITVVKCLPAPSPLIMAGTAESSVRIIDSRCMQYVNEWRVSAAHVNNATIRCLTVAPHGNWLAVGLSSGSIVTLDTRTGIIMNSWRPMECDMLQITAANDQQLVSSALDHSLAVWHANDGILHYQLKPPPEPAHFLQAFDSELVFATTGNRIGIYSDLSSSHASYTVTKLRSETFRGVLTSLAVLPLNRTFLAGNESGNIVLLC